MERYVILDDCPGRPVKIVILKKRLTPAFLGELRADINDTAGFKKYRQILRDAGFDIEAEPI